MENKQDKGFTLVELLIVIVILGILATVTVFAVRGITDQGQKSACSADTKTMETAVEAYFAQYGGATIALTLTQQTPSYTAAVAKSNAVALPGTGGTTEGTLQAAKFIVDPSTNVDVATDGKVTVTPLSKCVVTP